MSALEFAPCRPLALVVGVAWLAALLTGQPGVSEQMTDDAGRILGLCAPVG